MENNKIQTDLIYELKERAKELNCMYETQELLSDKEKSIDELFQHLTKIIPSGWQYPCICFAKITYKKQLFQSSNFNETKWELNSDIILENKTVGSLQVFYSEARPESDYGPFLKEEKKLIENITDQIKSYLFHQHLKSIFEDKHHNKKINKSESWKILDLLKKTNPKLLIII